MASYICCSSLQLFIHTQITPKNSITNLFLSLPTQSSQQSRRFASLNSPKTYHLCTPSNNLSFIIAQSNKILQAAKPTPSRGHYHHRTIPNLTPFKPPPFLPRHIDRDMSTIPLSTYSTHRLSWKCGKLPGNNIAYLS